MTGYVRATLAGGDASKIEAMAADVAAHPDAGAVALRESKFAWAELLRQQDRRADAVKLYRELAADVRSKEGSAAAYYVLEDTFEKGDMDKTEKAIFAYSEREPQAYWLAKAFILLATSMSARETISRRGRPTRASRTAIRLPTTGSWTKPRNGSQN